MNEFLKRFRNFDYRKFSDIACKFISACDQESLYIHFWQCATEDDVNEYVYELSIDFPDIFYKNFSGLRPKNK